MEFVFLLIRVLFGGWFAWIGARRLSPYDRGAVVAQTGQSPFTIALTGLIAVVGGACIITGIAVPVGVVLILTFVLASSGRMPRAQRVRSQVMAAVTVLTIAIEWL